MHKIAASFLFASAAMALAGCASVAPNDPVKQGQYVSVINSLTWTNPMSGKRDGLRSSWPLRTLKGQDERFPLAQLKQCAPGGQCAWGVMRAHRSLTEFAYTPDGVRLDLLLGIDIDRRQEVRDPDYQAAMAIPSDIPSLHVKRDVKRTLTLEYGKVQHIDVDYGVRLDVCALRYDAAGKALDVCDIPYI